MNVIDIHNDIQASDWKAKKWDAVIVGGGMVGAATALGLAQQNFEVLLLEQNEIDLAWNPDSEFRVRVSALTRASEKVLKNLGAWDGVLARRYHAFTAMHVWDEVSPGEVHFSAREMSEDNLGYTVENDVVQAALWEKIQQTENISVLYGADINRVEMDEQAAVLEINGAGSIQTELLIGADGAFSKLRQMAGIELETNDYDQCAVVGCVKTELSHQDTCWQRYTENGPFAFLSMDQNVSSIAWYLPTHKMDWALSLDDETFAREISQASDYRLGQVVKVGERSAFPLVRRHAEHYVKPHFALVGDAAHTIHPQAGQGVNLGLLDAAALIETVSLARQQNKSWGAFAVLRKYERWRRGDNAIVQLSMEAFDWLFKQDSGLKTVFRKTLLPLADRMTLMKNWLMGQALNGREALPKLAKQSPKN